MILDRNNGRDVAFLRKRLEKPRYSVDANNPQAWVPGMQRGGAANRGTAQLSPGIKVTYTFVTVEE